MPEINIDGMVFNFPGDWTCSKYDGWIFYRAYSRARTGTKAVDIVAITPDRVAWLVEVKDYRRHRRTKTIDLAEEVAQKVHDSLAVLFTAQTRSDVDNERLVAKKLAGANRLRVVLHLEQPAKHSKLFPRAIDPSGIQLKLRSLIKPVDPHPMVVESSNMQNLDWTVA